MCLIGRNFVTKKTQVIKCEELPPPPFNNEINFTSARFRVDSLVFESSQTITFETTDRIATCCSVAITIICLQRTLVVI